MAKKRKKKRGNNAFFLYLSIATILVLLWVNHNSKKMQVLYSEEYTKTYEAQAVIIKNEAVINFKDKIDFTVKEGSRASINKVIADSKNITFSEYYNREIDIINWLLANKAYRDKNLFDKDLTDIEEQLNQIEKDLKWAEKLGNEDKVKTLKKDQEALNDKKSYIVKSFQYMGVDEETLQKLKEDYSGMKDSTGSSITLKKLNFDFPGYIYFDSDGYESLLNHNILQYLTPQYIRDLDKYHKSDDKSQGQTVKVVDDTYMYLGIILPKDVVLSQEKRLVERKDEIQKAIETDDLSTYFQYLNKRVDVLKSLPTVTFKFDKIKSKGYLVDIREYGDEKVMIIELKDEINKKLLQERNISIELFTYANKGFIIPEKSIVNVEGKDNIVVLSKGYLKKYIQVKVTRKDEKNVFLGASDNKEITDGMQLIINP